MTLHRPIAQAAQTQISFAPACAQDLTTFSEHTTEARGIAVMLIVEAFGTPKAHMVAIEGYGISLSHSAIF